MKNIKLFTLLICFFLFQAAIFTTNAQCDDITLAAEVIEQPTCYNNGKIKVTIGGDVSKINLNTLEVSLTADGSGQSVGYSVWPSGGSSQEKIYSQAVKGNYIVNIRFHCQSGLDWYASSVSATVNVGGSYDPLVTTITTTRKSMTCKATGVVVINFTNGKAPFSGTITGPAGYTGQTTFSTSASSLTLNDAPAGKYTVTVSDGCNYGGTYTHDSPALDQDVVSTLYLNMARKSTSTDCRTIVPYSTNTVTDPSESHYWNNTSPYYYEYAYTLGSNIPPAANSSEWKTLSTKTPDFVLPQNYKDICSATPVPVLYSHIRPIGSTCTGVIRTFQHNLTSYVCATSIITVETYDGSTCSTAKLNAAISYYYGVCYPADWKVTPQSDPTNIIQSGTLSNYGTLVSYNSTSLDYPRGITYVITLTDHDGKVYTTTWTPSANQGQTFSGIYTYLVSEGANCMLSYGYLNTLGIIAPGTKFKYVDGPIPTIPCGLTLNTSNDTYTIPATGWTTNQFRFTNTNPLNSLSVNYQAVPNGNYIFEVTNSCGVTSTVTCGIAVWDVEPMDYTTQQTCSDGLYVTFPGRIFLRTTAGGISYNSSTYYRITGGPTGYTVNTNNYVAYNTPLTLPIPGTYTIGVFYSSPSYCNIATTTVEYPAGGLYIDPELTAAYACDDSSPGHIRVEAINGVKPYTYTVTSAPGTAYISPETSTTGKFDNIGTAGGTYIINVKDACNTEFNIPVTMISMTSANIVYTSNGGNFCNGSEIELNCVSLGSTEYKWRSPDGVLFSSVQRPRPIANSSLLPNSSAGSTGYYSVTVRPEGCTNEVTQSIYIQVTQPQDPTVTNANPTAPLNSGNADVVNLSGAAASLSGYTLKWYNSPTGTTTISAPTSVPTTALGSTTYYVSQVNASGCESARKMITFSVSSQSNSLRVNPDLRSFFYP